MAHAPPQGQTHWLGSVSYLLGVFPTPQSASLGQGDPKLGRYPWLLPQCLGS